MKFRIIVVAIILLISVFRLQPASSQIPENDAGTDSPVVRFGIITFYNPRLMVLRYQPFLDALSRRTNYTFKLVLSTSYKETVAQLERGEIDLAYLGPLTYIRARKRFGAIPLVRLNTGGWAAYQAVICVREDSEINSIRDLQGRSFAFGSPLSTSSHLYPRLMLKHAGIAVEDLSSFTYYRHHDRAAKAVLTGEADACGIRDVVAARYEDRGLRIIARSDPIPNFPLVVAPGEADTLLNILRSTLLSLDSHQVEDSLAMSQWNEELRNGFAPVSPDDYEDVERIMLEIFGTRAFEGDPSLRGAKPPARFGAGSE